MPPSRALPPELVRALRDAREVENSARRFEERICAMRATGQLMRAAVDEGWSIIGIARAMELNRHVASKRVMRARRLDRHEARAPASRQMSAARHAPLHDPSQIAG